MNLVKKIASVLLAVAITVPTAAAAMPAAASTETAASSYFIHRADRGLAMAQNGIGYVDSTDKAKYGDFTIETEGENAPYVKMKYVENGTLGNFFCMPRTVVANLLTVEHKYVRVTYKASHGGSLVMRNNSNSQKTTLVENTVESRGEWVTSEPVILDSTILQRFVQKGHNALIYNAGAPDAEICIKEIAFFTTSEEAYSYYGDAPAAGERYTVLDFGPNGSGKYNQNANYGNCGVNAMTGNVDIEYADTTNFKDIHYMAKLSFVGTGQVPADYRYFRVAYAVKLPDAADKATFIMRNDKKNADSYTFATDVNTNGEIVLSSAFKMSDETYNRLTGTGDYKNTGHFSFISSYEKEGAVFTVAALYFFDSEEEANAFVIPEKKLPKIEILGKSIEDYKIVIAHDASQNAVETAEYFTQCIKETTGVGIETVTDRTPVSASVPEIRIGLSNREGTDEYDTSYGDQTYSARVTEDGNIIINAKIPVLLPEAAKTFLLTYCGLSAKNVPDVIKLDASCSISGMGNLITRYEKWDEFENIIDPTVITDSFDSDSGYFSEDNGADVWSLSAGKYTAKAGDGMNAALVHAYEPNVAVTAELSFSAADTRYGDSSFGIVLRHTDKDSYAVLGYNADGYWFADYRESADFDRVNAARKDAKLTENKTYTLKAVADNGKITLYCDGKEVISADVPHVTPGKFGMFATNVTVSADSFEASLDSGEGTVLKNVSFTLMPEDTYFEGGTVIEMNDGSVVFQHHHGAAFKSTDDGKTWVKIPTWATSSGYTNIIRLNDGGYLRIWRVSAGLISQTSYDDGKTWTDGGLICPIYFEGTSAGAGNMNDKLTQTASGMLLYGQNYESKTEKIDGRSVFCEFYYSEDLGKTWHKSDTDSWEIEGNETETHFGECKLLECADGTIRMYNTWNYYGCLVYSDSTDGGKTFGPLVKVPEIKSTQSSMQFVRDPYAENDHTYYMVWVYDVEGSAKNHGQPRSRLSIAKSTDGKEWVYLGDVWRWEGGWQKGTSGVLLNHIVNPFINVTEDTLYVGSGISRFMGETYHNEQRQHVWAISKDTLPEGVKLSSFTDVKPGAPYYSAVMYAVENGLFNGTSATTFEPNTAMNRAMFVTVLGRLDKTDVAKYTKPTFDDVKAGEWYTSYVEWAAANGIVNGIGGGKYGVTGTVTVEQALTILFRYNGGKASDKPDGASLADFTDASKVSSWATDGVKWAVENGIYAGVGGKLDPASAASRATVATMFANYVKAFG